MQIQFTVLLWRLVVIVGLLTACHTTWFNATGHAQLRGVRLHVYLQWVALEDMHDNNIEYVDWHEFAHELRAARHIPLFLGTVLYYVIGLATICLAGHYVYSPCRQSHVWMPVALLILGMLACMFILSCCTALGYGTVRISYGFVAFWISYIYFARIWWHNLSQEQVIISRVSQCIRRPFIKEHV
jgi:hypothetical protein